MLIRELIYQEMIEDIKKACQVMSEGGVILYPTDTIWGIGCDATNEEAVRRVYEIKQRSDSKAMLVLVRFSGKGGFLCAGCSGGCLGFDRTG